MKTCKKCSKNGQKMNREHAEEIVIGLLKEEIESIRGENHTGDLDDMLDELEEVLTILKQ